MEWVRLVRAKGAQLARPRGGRQPHDKGLTAAERVLGVSRRDLGRAEKIASICSKAQEVIRRAKLDDIQLALLEIANEPTEQQVEKALELKERYRRPRGSRRTPDREPENGHLPEAESPNLAPTDDESDDGAEEKPAKHADTAPAIPSVMPSTSLLLSVGVPGTKRNSKS